MLKQLISKLTGQRQRFWTEDEIRELISVEALEQAVVACNTLHPSTSDRELRSLCLRGEIAFRSHQDDIAADLYEQALKLAPGFPDAHHGLSLLMHARGQHDTAFKHSLFALGSAPSDPRYLAQLALCHICLGNYSQAEDLLRRALYHAPKDKSTWNNLGLTLLSKGRPSEARSCFLNALKISPDFLPAKQNLAQLAADSKSTEDPKATTALRIGFDFLLNNDSNAPSSQPPEAVSHPWSDQWRAIEALATDGQRESALSSLEDLLQVFPDSDELAVLADRLYRVLGEANGGLAVLQAFLIRYPDSAIAQQGLGEALAYQADFSNAEIHLKRAVELGAHNEQLRKTLGKALLKQDRFSDAVPIYQSIQEHWPSDVNLAHLAVAQYQDCSYPEALSNFEALNAGNWIVRFGLESTYAMCLAYVGRTEEASTRMDELISRGHDTSSMLKMARASLHLLQEEFDHGWDGYRFRAVNLSSHRVLPVPEWQGEDLQGKTVVVLAEQGLGDQVMFASCLPDLLAMSPARVIVEAIMRVAPTLKRSFPQCEVVATRQDRQLDWLREIEGVDCYIPLGELPRHFRRSMADFPRQAYLLPTPERVRYWRSRLESLGPGPYFGTSWRGGTASTRTAIRTLPITLLQPLTTAMPSKWICLQYGSIKNEVAAARTESVDLVHWPEAIADLDEFAALISALDGVFTVCNTTVHYAGAVGQRTWVLAPTVPEWRYGLHNSHMPWYPHVEVLRQPVPNAWPELIELARQRLLDNYCPHINRQN